MLSATVGLSVSENGRNKPEYTLDSDIGGEVSLADFLDFVKQTLIVTADTVLKEEQDAGFDPNPVIAVDGRVGVPVQNVKPYGNIDIVARADIGDIVLDTYQSILDKSPVLTGTYKSSNFVFVNGEQVATDLASLQAWVETDPVLSDKDLIRFVNIEPYARKLERLGVTIDHQQSRTVNKKNKRTGRSISVGVPNGTYYITARNIRSKYRRNSIIQFEFISGTSLGITGNFRARRGKPGRAYLYPSIVISVQESGTL